MRERLYRFQLKIERVGHEGEWHEGSIIDAGNGVFYSAIAEECECKLFDCSFVGALVIPETIQEYTGMQDSNGRKIFEGDIIKIKYQFELVEAYKRKTTFVVLWDQEECRYFLAEIKNRDMYFPMSIIRALGGIVIGNLLDNMAENA